VHEQKVIVKQAQNICTTVFFQDLEGYEAPCANNARASVFILFFINALQQVCRTPGPTAY